MDHAACSLSAHIRRRIQPPRRAPDRGCRAPSTDPAPAAGDDHGHRRGRPPLVHTACPPFHIYGTLAAVCGTAREGPASHGTAHSVLSGHCRGRRSCGRVQCGRRSTSFHRRIGVSTRDRCSLPHAGICPAASGSPDDAAIDRTAITRGHPCGGGARDRQDSSTRPRRDVSHSGDQCPCCLRHQARPGAICYLGGAAAPGRSVDTE